jgi:hypothetical protein
LRDDAPPLSSGSLRAFADRTSYSAICPPVAYATVIPSGDHTGPSPSPSSRAPVPSARISHTAFVRAFFANRSTSRRTRSTSLPATTPGALMRFIAARSS